MSIKITTVGAAVLLISVSFLEARAESVSVLGPLEAVSLESKTLIVLGQTYKFDSNAFSGSLPSGVARGKALQVPALGTLVSVQGDRNASGDQAATTIHSYRPPYIPGATDIYLLGVAATYDATTAVAEVGGVRVFIGDIVGARSTLTVGQGALLEIVGRQSQPGGLVWATAINVVRGASVPGEKEAVADVSVQSITGTGVSMQSITGTGVSASTQSITGTGVSASAQSITGTGKSTQSITGTGASTQSITGTGVSASAQSITGTGKSAQSITGTGASTQSITGTGVSASAQSITGTGASTQSITGTGVSASAQSITGTGKSAQSITGTGASTQSITGTGVSAQSITGTGASS
jgi:hypothetical protein